MRRTWARVSAGGGNPAARRTTGARRGPLGPVGGDVHSYTGSYLLDVNFEDDDHVLISARLLGGDADERDAALLRCGLDGSCELATPVARAMSAEQPYGLGLQRW